MDQAFWHQKWANNEIGFHRDTVHSFLEKYWRTIKPKEPGSVLVPCCGKSVDMLWLANLGYEVVGIELSKKAVEKFFEENQLQPSVSESDHLSKWQCENISLICGDIFEVESDLIGPVSAVYDRAALIAMPAELRERYVNKILQLAHKASVLLVTMEYHQSEISGPPFSVDQKMVENYYPNHRINCIEKKDILLQEAVLMERGLTSLTESVYLLDLIT